MNEQTKNTHYLLQLDVTGSLVDVVSSSGTRRDHVSLVELHGLGTLTTHLTGNDDFATLGIVLHNITEDAVASAADGQHTEELSAEVLSVGNGAHGTVEDATQKHQDTSEQLTV